MTIDQEKSVKLLVCARHSQRVLRPLKNTTSLPIWLRSGSALLLIERLGSRLIWTVSTTTAVHQVSALPQKAQVSRRSPLGAWQSANKAEATVRLPVQRFSSSKCLMLACVAQ